MSHGLTQLHSHSGLERDLKLPKHTVLVDASFGHLFHHDLCVPFRYNGVDYYKVSTLMFIKNGGVFKNLNG